MMLFSAAACSSQSSAQDSASSGGTQTTPTTTTTEGSKPMTANSVKLLGRTYAAPDGSLWIGTVGYGMYHVTGSLNDIRAEMIDALG